MRSSHSELVEPCMTNVTGISDPIYVIFRVFRVRDNDHGDPWLGKRNDNVKHRRKSEKDMKSHRLQLLDP